MAAIKTTAAVKTKARSLKRYIVKLAYSKPKGFFVTVSHAKHKRAGRVVVRGALAAKAMPHKTVEVILKGGKFVTRILKPSFKSRVLRLASVQVGYKESPSGSNHTKYGVWFGLDHEPWCAIFVSYVLSLCGRPFKYSYVPYIVNDAKAGKNGLSTIPYGKVERALKDGHVVLACYDWPGESPGVADHIGIVSKVLSSTLFEAIEGNTSVGNNSNGGEVMRRKRITSEVQAFILVSKS